MGAWMAGGGRVLCVLGTRPEAIKLAPLLLAARLRPHQRWRALATGQQPALTDDALADFGLVPDLRLAPIAPDPDPDVFLGRLTTALLPVLAHDRPDLVVVQGDTSSAYAGALAAAELGLPIAHVEAGLRSGDLANPWPEERNRTAIDGLAALLFAPTAAALAHLLVESQVRGAVHVTGNTGIDALLRIRAGIARTPPEAGRHLVLLTCHRRESIGARIAAICDAVRRLVAREDVAILCPVHTNPAVAATVRAMLGGEPRVALVPPLSYRETVQAMLSARLILTDSGGIQEEAATLGVPTLVLRSVTERPEGLEAGALRLVGTDPDRIVAEAARLLDDDAAHAAMARASHVYGDGRAAERILDHVDQYFSTDARDDLPLPSSPVWRRNTAPKGA